MDFTKTGLNCLKCHHRDQDNGNCTAVGGFCTAVPAAYCPLIPELISRAEAAEKREAELRELLAVVNNLKKYYPAGQEFSVVTKELSDQLWDRVKCAENRAEAAEADNKKLCAAMMNLKLTGRPERMSVVYELEYDSSLSHKTMEEVAVILFKGLMDADLKLRGKKEG